MILVREQERGTALLSVLLLVAVMATIAATALDRIKVTTQLAANSRASGQAYLWLASAELLALTRIEDLKATSNGKLTLAGDWLDTPRTIALPDGTQVVARIADGGNCFNLNALARKVDQTVLASRPEGIKEFQALMTSLGIDAGKAAKIAASAADYIDDDDVVSPGGAERGSYPVGSLPANRPMADRSELRAVPGVSADDYRRLERWVCALPVIGQSPVNVNTLRPEEAPLAAMLFQGALPAARARDILARRPASGFASADQFISATGAGASDSARTQVAIDSNYFVLKADILSDADADLAVGETALMDASKTPARILSRQWGSN